MKDKIRGLSFMASAVLFFSLGILSAQGFAFEAKFTEAELDRLNIKINAIQEKNEDKSKEEIWSGLKEPLLSQKPSLGDIFKSHKLNYLTINSNLDGDDAQVKFQISVKVDLIRSNSRLRDYFPLHFAYSQKSFWNVGKPSMPFEESNYNPEIFLEYTPKNLNFKNLKLKKIILAPYEHESNGEDGSISRSWNRTYLSFLFSIFSQLKEKERKFSEHDKYEFYIKLWDAYSYEDQDEHLQSIGKDGNFLDYAGRGEIGLSIRDFWGSNQFDAKTRIFRNSGKGGYELNYSQGCSEINFHAFLQYWNGYGESLIRFAKKDEVFRFGVSFPY